MVICEVPLQEVWRMRQVIMYPELCIDDVKLQDDEKGMHLGLYEEAQLISVVSVFIKEEQLQFRKFATLQAYQGKGYGSKLLQYVFDLAQKQNLKIIWCNARVTAIKLYQKFGMHQKGEPWQQKGYQFIKMVKALR